MGDGFFLDGFLPEGDRECATPRVWDLTDEQAFMEKWDEIEEKWEQQILALYF